MLFFLGSKRVGHDCVTELHRTELQYWSSQVALVVKNLPANARDAGSIPVLEDPQEKGMATHSSMLDWKTHGWRGLVVSYVLTTNGKEAEVEQCYEDL